MKGLDTTYEYAFSAVPAERRKATSRLVFILTGFAFSSSGLTLGTELGKGMPFFEAAGASILGNFLLFLIALFWGMLGYESGYSSIYLVKRHLGNKVAVVTANLLVFFMIIWIGMNGSMLARTMLSIFPRWPLPISITALLVVVSFILCSLNGWRSMEFISRLCVPFILIMTIHNLLQVTGQKEGFGFLFQYQPEKNLAFGTAFIMIAGNFSLSAVTMADICRFAKSRRAVFTCVSAYALTLTANNLCGIVIAQATGANNLSYAIYLLGNAGAYLLWLLLSAYTTQNVNMYTGSLAIQKLVRRTGLGGNISHKTAVFFIGGLSIIAGVIGVSRYIVEITGINILLVLPITIAVVMKIFSRKRKVLEKNEKVL